MLSELMLYYVCNWVLYEVLCGTISCLHLSFNGLEHTEGKTLKDETLFFEVELRKE